MKIIKPLTLGILNRPYRYRGQHRLAIAALGFFRLGMGTTDRFMTENLQWAKLIPTLPLGVPLDHILPKARAEVMLSGKAHAPEAIKAMTVRMQCGPVDKRLRVIGERHWRRVLGLWLCIDDAKPFTAMPLDWENAYGGPDYAANPLGRGYLPGLQRWRQREGQMPTLEPINSAITPGRRRLMPAGFSPFNLLHSPLRTQSGTYDQRWLEEDFPGLPRDFNFGTYNLSPPDQQFAGAFHGDEGYRLEGLHPQHPVVEGTLPGLRARAFILREGKEADSAEEVALHCDTVWFFPECDIGMQVYRGEVEVADSDALDVMALMAAYEAIADTPRPLAHYREVMGLRMNRETAGLHAFNESQLAPQRSAAELAARAQRRAEAAATELAKRQQQLDAQMARFWQDTGMPLPTDYVSPKVAAPLIMPPSADDIAEGEFDLAELKAQAEVVAANAKHDGEAKLAAAQSTTAATPSVAAITQRALLQARQVAHDLLGTPAPLPPALQDLLLAAQNGGLNEAQQKQMQESLAHIPALRRAARNAATHPTLAAPLPDATALALRRLVQQCLRDGESLAGRDLAGANLSKLDLCRVDLREVQLERADLRGAQLAGANLARATLTAANLGGADLSDVDLSGANLSGSQAQGACFDGANLSNARAVDADWSGARLRKAVFNGMLATGIVLTEADLDDCQITQAILADAKAPRSRWQNTRWHTVVATGIDLSSADFCASSLEKSVLLDANLVQSQWARARLGNVYAGGKSNWEHSVLRGARFSRCGFHGARLVGADMRGGTFAQCDFGTADLSDADLSDTRLYRSLFMRSRLRRVHAENADFFQAQCRKADFSDANLHNANLTQADTEEALWKNTKLAGASVQKKARL